VPCTHFLASASTPTVSTGFTTLARAYSFTRYGIYPKNLSGMQFCLPITARDEYVAISLLITQHAA